MPHTEALTDTFETADRLVLEALELPPDERMAFVETRCADNADLAQEVRSLVELESTPSVAASLSDPLSPSSPPTVGPHAVA